MNHKNANCKKFLSFNFPLSRIFPFFSAYKSKALRRKNLKIWKVHAMNDFAVMKGKKYRKVNHIITLVLPFRGKKWRKFILFASGFLLLIWIFTFYETKETFLFSQVFFNISKGFSFSTRSFFITKPTALNLLSWGFLYIYDRRKTRKYAHNFDINWNFLLW